MNIDENCRILVSSNTVILKLTVNLIRIFNRCEVLVVNSVTRVTIWLHEACRGIPNPSDGIFNLHRRTIMDSFFLHTFAYSCFISFTLKFKKSSVRLLSYTLTSKHLAETDVKMTSDMTSKRQNRHADVMHESRLTSLM